MKEMACNQVMPQSHITYNPWSREEDTLHQRRTKARTDTHQSI